MKQYFLLMMKIDLKIMLLPKDPNDEKNYILGQIYKRNSNKNL